MHIILNADYLKTIWGGNIKVFCGKYRINWYLSSKRLIVAIFGLLQVAEWTDVASVEALAD